MNFYRWFTNWLEFWFGVDLKPKEKLAENFKNTPNYETIYSSTSEIVNIVLEKKKPKAKKTTKKPRQKKPKKEVNVSDSLDKVFDLKETPKESVLNTKTEVYIEPEKAYTKPKSSKRTKRKLNNEI